MDKPTPQKEMFGAAEIGALAHLYRGEMYRSKIWRTRLDATTNWAVVSVGIALSVTFASEHASPLPLILVGPLLCVFLLFEARRYRFFDIFRTRVRVMETSFYCPILMGRGIDVSNGWNRVLADDYTGLYYHISFWEALGRRLRRNYMPIFAVQLLAYVGKLIVHPTPLAGWRELFERAAVGPIPGELALAGGALFYTGLVLLAVWTKRNTKAVGRARPARHDDMMRTLTSTELY